MKSIRVENPNVLLKNVPRETTRPQILDLCISLGTPAADVFVKRGNTSLAWVFIRLCDPAQTGKAVEMLHRRIMGGQVIRAERFNPNKTAKSAAHQAKLIEKVKKRLGEFHSEPHPTWHGSWQPSEATR